MMAENTAIENWETYHRNDETRFLWDFNFKPSFDAIKPEYAIIVFLSVVGTLLNLSFLIVMLTSRDMRSRLRNKIICNILVVQLLDSAIIFPAEAVHMRNLFAGGCVFKVVFMNLTLIQDFIANWLVLMLLVVFIAQIKQFNPKTRLAPRTITVGTFGLILLPWVVSVSVISIFIARQYNSRMSWEEGPCIYLWFEFDYFKYLERIVFIILAIILLIAAAVLRCYRFTPRPRNSTGSTSQVDLVWSGPDIDKISVYVIAVTVCIFCDLPHTLGLFHHRTFKTSTGFEWSFIDIVFDTMSDVRVILMTLPWFLLSDVKLGVRTSRPCNRSTPGNELIVTYTKLHT